MRTDTGVTTFGGSGLKVAGTTATFDGRLDEKGWQVKGRTGTTTVAALRKFAAPWFELPKDITGDGKVAVEGGASRYRRWHAAGRHAETRWRRPHQRGQHHRHRQARRRPRGCARDLDDADTALELDIAGKQGQVLVDPVLLDFGKNPLALEVARQPAKVMCSTIESLRLTQTDLIELTGTGSVNLAGETPLVSGDFKLAKFEFPAAYTSYMQITLATTSVLSDLQDQR